MPPPRGSVLCLALFCCAPLATAGPPDPATADLEDWRAWVEAQPRTFDNEVLFRIEDGEMFRSDRFAQAGGAFGDFDGDGDVDLFDYTAFQICLSFSGPGFTTPLPCYVFDSDGDLDIDLVDVGAFINALTGSIRGVHVEAGALFPVVAYPDGYYSGPPGAWGNNALNGFAHQAGYTQDDLWYEWSIVSQPDSSGEVIIANSSRPETAYTILPPFSPGDYVFRLKVTNLLTFEFGHDTVRLLVRCIYETDCYDAIPCTTDTCNIFTGACSNASNCTGGLLCNLQSGHCE